MSVKMKNKGTLQLQITTQITIKQNQITSVHVKFVLRKEEYQLPPKTLVIPYENVHLQF